MDSLAAFPISTTMVVANWLKDKGYRIANTEGRLILPKDTDEKLGLLSFDRVEVPSFFSFLPFNKVHKGFFYGVVWFRNEAFGASNRSWVFRVHGSEHMVLMEDLARKMRNAFQTRVVVQLSSKKPAYEQLRQDEISADD